MRKTIAYRLFGIGRVPETHARALEEEGIVVRDEGVGASIAYRRVRGPGRFHWGKYTAFTGSVVLTKRTFAAFWWHRPVVLVRLDDERIAALACTVTGAGALRFRFETSVFHEGWSGVVTLTYKTSHGKAIADRLRESGASALET
ncbi:MAG: hypothetical protein HY721_01075 [Planctomycetes bacterium]|nr:hypothetical protein [Planctomycetota bacterium]